MRYEGYLFLKNEIVFREIPIIDVPRRIFNGIRCSIDFLIVSKDHKMEKGKQNHRPPKIGERTCIINCKVLCRSKKETISLSTVSQESMVGKISTK